ncbi:hypothetical protein R1flu_023391 [Riccia fluitans]|uniref:Zinc finger PHD-type domain-containing protein n=1 Tax=Riccia fluitans TaxID=41844 RepID=A0ABD1XSE3_9MARC
MGNRGRNDSRSESDDWEDESWIVDCPCGVNFDDGDEMIECDECGVWVHTACCRVSKTLPSYVCEKCKYKKKQKEDESEVARLLADLPSRPVTFEEKDVQRAELYPPIRVSNNLPTEAKAHVTGVPGGDPSFFVGAPKVFGRQLWANCGYVPKRFDVEYHQLGDPREDTEELLRDLPNVVVPPAIEERLKRLAHLQGRQGTKTRTYQGSPIMSAGAAAPNPGNVREVYSAELPSSDTQVAQDGMTPGSKEANSGQVKIEVKTDGKVDRKVEGKLDGEIDGKSRHRHKSKVKDEKLHHHAKRAREDVGLKESGSKKKIKIRADVKSEAPVESLARLEVLSDTGYVSVTHAVSQISPKNPKTMKKLAVQEFMHGVIRICSKCRGSSPVPVSCGRTYYFSEWTCQKCGSLEGGFCGAGSPSGSGRLKQEPGTTMEMAGICSDGGLGDRKRSDHNDAVVKTPRYRDEYKQTLSAVDFSPGSSIHGNESGRKDPMDLELEEQGAPHKELGRHDNSQELDTRLESPGKRVKRANHEKEAGELLERRSDSSEHRATRRHLGIVESGEELAPRSSLVKAASEPKSLPAVELRSAAGSSPQVERKDSKLLVTSGVSEVRGQGSARTSGCVPASVREKFSQQQQRAAPSSAGASQQTNCVQSPRQRVVSPSSGGGASGIGSVNVCHTEESTPVYVVGHGESHTYVSKQFGRFLDSGLEGTHKLQEKEGSQDFSISFQRVDSGAMPSSKIQSGDSKEQIPTEGQSPVRNSPVPTSGGCSAGGTQEQRAPLPICQQARQSNGIGTYSRKTSGHVGGASSSHNSEKTAANVRTTISTKSDIKGLGGQLRSPLSPGTSSSPTSPLVTTPSSKAQSHISKASGSPPPQKSSHGGISKSSSIPSHGGSKVSTPGTTTCKQVGTLHTSKSVPTPSTPLSSKTVNMSKHPSKPSLPSSKSDTVLKSSNAVASSRGGGNCGPSSGASAKDTLRNVSHSSSKAPSAGKIVPQPTVVKPPSSSKHPHGTIKAVSALGQNKQPSGSSKISTKPTTVHYSRTHKEEKSSTPPAPPAVKAVSTMAPIPSAKRSPPTVLTSPATSTLKDEELALLLHQELNSSPRVPRVPRVRQPVASRQSTSASHEPLSSARSAGSASGAGGSQKTSAEHHLALRRRTREERLSNKDGDRYMGKIVGEEATKGGVTKGEDGKSDDGKNASASVAVNISLSDGKGSGGLWSSQGGADGRTRVHLLGKGSLSIIVPGADDVPNSEKTSPVDGNVATLSGLIEDIFNSKGLQISYEDICEAVLPHWPKLRKLNGERYSFSSHRQAVLESLKSRPAWAHLVDRPKGLRTYVARKRRRNELTALSDSESDPATNGAHHSAHDGLGPSKSSKRSKVGEGLKGDGGSSSVLKSSADASKGKYRVRRRRRLTMDEETDGEDDPLPRTAKDSGTPKAASVKGVSQEEEPDSVTSPSSEEAVSNYSEEDEEMVVHRVTRNRRRRGDNSTSSEDDRD